MELLKLKGWKFYTDGVRFAATHTCGTEYGVFDIRLGEHNILLEIVKHVC